MKKNILIIFTLFVIQFSDQSYSNGEATEKLTNSYKNSAVINGAMFHLHGIRPEATENAQEKIRSTAIMSSYL